MFKQLAESIRVPPATKQQKRQTYRCKTCKEGWESETDVEIHRRQRHRKMLEKLLDGKNNGVCTICITDQGTPEKLLQHIKTAHLLSSEDATRIEREIFICNNCTSVFFNKKMLAIHLHTKHKAKNKVFRGKLDCPKCGKVFKASTTWSHLSFEDIFSVSCCAICLKKCQNLSELEKHYLSHRKHFYCDICSFNTKSSDVFREHISKCSQIDCNVDEQFNFSKIFLSNGFYKKWRMFRLHASKGLTLPGNITICVLCREICSNVDEMKRHYFVHANSKISNKIESLVDSNVKKKNVCTCGAEFFSKILLKQHVFRLRGEHKEVVG